jgi:hypothetical protein
MKTFRGTGSINPHILQLDTGWKIAVNFIPWPLYSQENGAGWKA